MDQSPESGAVDYESDAEEAAELPEGDRLERLSALVHRMRELEEHARDLGESLKLTNEELRKVSEVDVPGLLDELQLSELRLPDGTKVTIREDLKVTTTGKRRLAILSWLEAEGHGDIIKDQVSVVFGKGEGDQAEELCRVIEARGQAAERDRTVHPQTLKALLKELLQAGEEVPLDELGVFPWRAAKLEAPR